MVENDGTDATHPRRAFAWVCAGGLSAVTLLATVFLNIYYLTNITQLILTFHKHKVFFNE
jgi:hypothetical protein